MVRGGLQKNIDDAFGRSNRMGKGEGKEVRVRRDQGRGAAPALLAGRPDTH